MALQCFLEHISSTMSIPMEELSVVAQLRSGGPTVQPGPAKDNQIVKTYDDVANKGGPSANYDQLGSRHIDYSIIRTTTQGEIIIPTSIYSWQHHPLPGCCKFAVNRWVRSQLHPDLNVPGLSMRREIARKYGYTTLYVSKGPSGGASAEQYDQFTQIYDDGHRQMFVIPTENL
jgi:hypothetical protein